MVPVHGIVVELVADTSVFTDTQNAGAVKQAVVYTDIVSCNCIDRVVRSRTGHPEAAFVVMAVIVLIHNILVAVVKIKCHAILITLRMGRLIVLHGHIIAVPHPNSRMRRVSAVIPVLAGAFYDQVLLCNAAVCIDQDDAVTGYIIDIVLCHIYIWPSDPSSFSGFL